ncbi:hypothetical protein Ddye_014737 [Dipteronia dyeriana]|uniref:Uncharacterized protein n=1 Tax=Dipteronia dyeriana TaxID=168575 RepID=A0AAE0CKW6_9ROSI|nr:hypothetical protein Ddye_014737 [Dipteronia dyeriana]
MKTRSGSLGFNSKAIEVVLVDKSVEEKEAIKVSEGVQLNVNLKGSAHHQQFSEVKKTSWNLKEELAKVIKAGVDLGCDFKGRENDIIGRLLGESKLDPLVSWRGFCRLKTISMYAFYSLASA